MSVFASNNKRVEVQVPAKVNLTLEILGKRPDGYHELRSVVMPVGLFDTVWLEDVAGSGVEVKMRGEGVGLEAMCGAEGNLAVRAARVFQRRMGVARGVRIGIVKRIPLGGGLGGGSADAAGVLRGLGELWGVKVGRAALLEMAAELGSDVGAMALGGAVMMTGRGERARRIRVPEGRGMWMVIANDGTHCPTPEVYKQYAREGRGVAEPGLCHGVFPKNRLTLGRNFSHTITFPVRSGDVKSAAAALYNGLQEVVFSHYPSVAALARELAAAGGEGVLLSGSGASVFALVQGKRHGEEVRKRLGSRVWSVLVETLPDGVTAAHGPLEARVMVRIHVGQPFQ